MSGHHAVLSESVLQSLPSKVSRVAQGMLLAIGIASTGISIAGEWSHGHHFLNQWLLQNVRVLGALLNLLLVALVLFPGRIQPLNDDVGDQTVRLSAQCINLFCLRALTWFWRCLGLLYVVQFFSSIVGAYPHRPMNLGEEVGVLTQLPVALKQFFNTGSTLAIALAYVFLTPGFLRSYVGRMKAVEIRNQLARPGHWRDWPVFWICLALVLPVGGLATITHLFVLEFPKPYVFDQIATLANGLAAAVALGYFVGRMDSKFILNWQWVIPFLYSYAGIQVYSSLLDSPNEVTQAMFVYAAFTMKCVLFIFLSNFFESRRILYYAVELVETGKRNV